jgi:hypothetical protein
MKAKNKKKEIIKTIVIFGLGVAVGYSVARPDKVKALLEGLVESRNKGVNFIKHHYK